MNYITLPCEIGQGNRPSDVLVFPLRAMGCRAKYKAKSNQSTRSPARSWPRVTLACFPPARRHLLSIDRDPRHGEKDPSIEPNRHVLDAAYNSIVLLLRHDQYARYTDHIIVQRQLRVSALDALWWRQVKTRTTSRGSVSWAPSLCG